MIYRALVLTAVCGMDAAIATAQNATFWLQVHYLAGRPP